MLILLSLNIASIVAFQKYMSKKSKIKLGKKKIKCILQITKKMNFLKFQFNIQAHWARWLQVRVPRRLTCRLVKAKKKYRILRRRRATTCAGMLIATSFLYIIGTMPYMIRMISSYLGVLNDGGEAFLSVALFFLDNSIQAWSSLLTLPSTRTFANRPWAIWECSAVVCWARAVSWRRRPLVPPRFWEEAPQAWELSSLKINFFFHLLYLIKCFIFIIK